MLFRSLPPTGQILRSTALRMRTTAPEVQKEREIPRSAALGMKMAAQKVPCTAESLRSKGRGVRSTGEILRSTALRVRTTAQKGQSAAGLLRNAGLSARNAGKILRRAAPGEGTLPRIVRHLASGVPRFALLASPSTETQPLSGVTSSHERSHHRRPPSGTPLQSLRGSRTSPSLPRLANQFASCPSRISRSRSPRWARP